MQWALDRKKTDDILATSSEDIIRTRFGFKIFSICRGLCRLNVQGCFFSSFTMTHCALYHRRDCLHTTYDLPRNFRDALKVSLSLFLSLSLFFTFETFRPTTNSATKLAFPVHGIRWLRNVMLVVPRERFKRFQGAREFVVACFIACNQLRRV